MKVKRVLTFVGLTALLFFALHVTIKAQQTTQTIRTIFNNVWDRANHQLMTTPGVGAQGTFETETTILNDVWDSANNLLRVSGGGGGSGDVSSNTALSVDGEGVLFSGTGGKTVKRATGTGVARLDSGVQTVGELSGDVTTSGSNVATVGKVNGVVYGAAPASNTVPVVTASNTVTYKAIADCDDTLGQHVNYDTATNSFSCGVGQGFVMKGNRTQSGTSYTMVAADEGKLLIVGDAAAVAITLPNPSTSGFGEGALFVLRNTGNGVVTITPTGTTINGGSTITFTTQETLWIFSNGTSYGATRSTAAARYMTVECIADATTVTTGDGKCYIPIHPDFDTWIVFKVSAHVGAAVSSSGVVTVAVDRCGAVATGVRCSGTNVDVLSTLMTIDANEDGTETAATPAVINGANDDLSVGQWLRVNVDTAGTGTQGLYVTIGIRREQ